MAIYAKKYNKNLKKWEVVSPTSDNDIVVLNNNYTESGTPVTLNQTLNHISGDIEKLQRNVSWLAEHGGGGGGYGTGSTSNYGITVINGGLKDKQLYVSSNSCTVSFRITGGTATDTVQYRITYDGNYLDYNYTKVSVNTRVDIEITDLEKYQTITPHAFNIEAIDPDGMTIPSYELNIVETSIVLTTADNYIFNVGEGTLTVGITNKVLNSVVTISVYNATTDKKASRTFTSNTTDEQTVDFNFFDEDNGLVDKSSVKEGNKYNLTINGQATINQSTFYAEEITTSVLIQGSTKIVIILNDLPTEEEFNNLADDKKKVVSSNGNLSFGFTPFYNSTISSVYYAVRLRRVDGYTKAVAGNYDLLDGDGNQVDVSQNPYTSIGVIRTIAASLSKDFIGEKVFVDVKCWSNNGENFGTVTGAFKVDPANTDIYGTQVPIRGLNSTVGNAMYASWGNNEFTNATQKPNGSSVVSSIDTYLPVGSNNGEPPKRSEVTMNVYGTNGEVNGFKSEKGSASFLRLSNEAYATVDISGNTNDKNDINQWKSNDGFTISITFKSDYHPYNDRTIFFMGENDDDKNFKSGLKIDLEKVYWYFIDGNKVQQKMEVNIKQNELTTVDFVYVHKNTFENNQYVDTGTAKIYVNGIINAAKEANIYYTDIPNKIYLGSNALSNNTIWNNADVNIYDLRIFNKYLNDVEVVINSHNDRAERDEDGTINPAEYKKWKDRNYLSNTTSPTSIFYNALGYSETVGYADLKNDGKAPLPIVYLDGRSSGFKEDTFFSTNLSVDDAKKKYTGFDLYYYDPNVGEKGKEVHATDIEVSIQGTSTTTLKCKNLELYFTKDVGNGKVEMFQPKDTWFPESEFTLKADVVDSAHANNATIGKWINEYGAKSVLEDNPAMIAASEQENKPQDIDENGSNHGRQEKPTVKHTLEGFPVIVIMQFDSAPTPTLLGIYSFNLGRYSYFNMGFNFLKSFSRRKSGNNYEDEDTPALIDTYEPYNITDKNHTISYNNGQNQIDLSRVYSFEFGSDADDNDSDHATWSQDSPSIIKHLGEFKYNGAVTPHDSQPSTPISETEDNPWNTLRELFAQTARISPTSKIYTYESGNFNHNDEDGSYSPTDNVETFVKKLSIKNAYGYFVIAMAFGMVDSLGKNMTLRTWGDGKWYPAFYDMDTALGLTNAGDETVPSTAYIDSFENKKTTNGPNTMVVTRNAKQTNGYGAYNSKLWNILRGTSDEQGSKSTWANLSKDVWSEGFYGEFWKKLRDYTKNEDGTTKGPLSSPDNFLSLFTAQTKDVGEMVYNADFNVKYLGTYYSSSGNYSRGNIEMLHGTRIEYIRSWLKDRFCFLDGVLNYASDGNIPYPYYKFGQITCGGPDDDSDNPKFTISTTSPTIFTANIGQNGELSKWFIPAYKDTLIILPHLSSDFKRITINSTTIISKLDGLKGNRFNKFESMSLPSLSEIDLDSVESFVNTPVDFSSTFVDTVDGKRVSDIRKINLSNTNKSNVTDFPVTLSGQTSLGSFNYWKLKSIDISDSCVTSLVLPSSPLSNLNVKGSNIAYFDVENQPYLPDDAFNFTNCNSLQNIIIKSCNGIESGLTINSMNILKSLEVSNCDKIQSIVATGNTKLTSVSISSCSQLTSLNLNGCDNEDLQITISKCPKLKTIILSNLKTKKPIIMPKTTEVNSIVTLDLRYSSGIDGFRFGDDPDVLQCNGENVLDLSAFSGLTSNGLKMQNASSVKYVKFANDESNPFSLTTSFFNGCTSLKRVFGNIELKGQSIFKGCTNFSIHDKPTGDTEVSEVVTEFVQNNENNKGFVTNIQIGTSVLSEMFRSTSCNLYDVYYILLKCDNVTNISYMFTFVNTIETNAGSNSLQAKAFSHCGKVENAENLFWGCGFNTRIPSPEINNEGDVTSNGMLQYMPNLTAFTGTFNGCYVYADDKLFYKTNEGKKLKIKNISWFNPVFVKDANSTEITAALAEAGKLFRYMPDLNSIDNSFNSTSIYFSHVDTGLKIDNTDIYSTDIFYKTTKLTTVAHSFRSLTACGYIRNIFGGYKTTRNKSDYFPSKITTVVDSFSVSTIGGNDANKVVFDDGEKNIANVYIGDSFLANISSSIQYLGTSDGSSSNSLFYGKFSKYVDTVDLDGVDVQTKFPYKVLLNCKNLKEAPGFFYGIKRPENITGDALALPYYTENNEKVSMFKDAVRLTNFAYGFSNLQIPFTLEGFGFANATNLSNVTGLFQNSNLQGQVPYGLFYREEIKKYPSMNGLTYADANAKHINSGDYGVQNLVVSGGKVTVELDKDGKITTSKSESFTSGGTIYYMDDYGELCIATSGNNKTTIWTDSKGVAHTGSTDDIKNPVYSTDEAISTFSGSYKTCICNITKMDSIFSGIKSEDLVAYTLDVNKDKLTLENYKSSNVVEDNPNYSPIFVLPNDKFNPQYWIHNSIDGTRTKNPDYDPRRVIGNSAYDNYPKIWNKWINDGTSTLYDAIIKSEIYDKIGKDGDIGISSGLPDDISSTSANSVTTSSLDEIKFPDVLSNITDKIKPRQQTRNYFVAGDLFRYCTSNASIHSAFKGSGGNNVDTPYTGWPYSIKKGFYGSIPPFFFENVKNTTSLANMFSGVKGLTPYSWAQNTTVLGDMFPPDLLNGMKSLTGVSRMFESCYIYPYEKIPDLFFASNTKLQDLSYLFYDCKFADTGTTREQVPESLFSRCSGIQNVKYMFCKEEGWSFRAPHKISKKLFTYENNPSITNVDYFMFRASETSGEVPEFWEQFKISYHTHTYQDVGTTDEYKIGNYDRIPKEWK